METKTARRCSFFDGLDGQSVKNHVCSFWLAGKCNRNPCRFMHRESPPPPPQHYHPSTSFDSDGEKFHIMTWKNPNYSSAKKDIDSANERNRSNGNRGLQTQQKVSNFVTAELRNMSNGNRGLQTQQKVSNVETAEPEINRVEKGQPNQCKYWITGNCTLGSVVQDSPC